MIQAPSFTLVGIMWGNSYVLMCLLWFCNVLTLLYPNKLRDHRSER